MAPILRRFNADLERMEDERKIARIILDIGEAPATSKAKRTGNRSAEGDPRRLRGIPAIGRSVSGVAPGTDPVTELLRSAA